MARFKMSLLENSNNFLREALLKAIAAESDQEQWKFAVFCLVQSIELSLKERLKREHEILIYEKIDRPKRTVTLLQALDRLNGISKISILESDIDAIRTASVWRNNILHYEFEISIDSAKLVFAKLFSFLSDFDRKHFNLKIDELIPRNLFDEAVAIREYSEELYKRANDRFRDEKIDKTLVWNCRNCGYDSFVIQDDIDTCFVCGIRDEIIECSECGKQDYEDNLSGIDVMIAKEVETRYLCDSCMESIALYHDDEYM